MVKVRTGNRAWTDPAGIIPLMIAAGLLASGCSTEPSADRRLRDAQIGILENDAYRFAADDGLLHVKDSSETMLAVRASAAEFSARIVRKRSDVASVRLRIANLRDNPVLTIAGIDTPGTADSELIHGWSWAIPFTAGTDGVTVRTPALAPQDFRFLAFGDIQNGITRFGDMVDAVNRETGAEFILMLGDLTSRTRPEEFAAVEAQYARINVPIYTTPGNHDVMREREYQDRYGRANYSFTHRGVRFISMDSSGAELDPVAWDWVQGWMRLGRAGAQVIFSHIPVTETSGIRSGQWNSRREALKFVASARDNGVDLMLFGHVHSYYAYDLAGIPTYISGGCGAIEEKLDGIDRHYLRLGYTAATGAISTEVVRIE